MDVLDGPVAPATPAPRIDALGDILNQLAGSEAAKGGPQAIREFLEGRYRWAIDTADSITAYRCLRGLDLLQPGFLASETPSFIKLLERDMRAVMDLGDGPRAFAMAAAIQELDLSQPCAWIVFNLAIACRGAGMNKEAVALNRWVNDHGPPDLQRDAASNLYFCLAGAEAFDEIVSRMQKCSPPPELLPEALVDARCYERARAAARDAFERSPKTAEDYIRLFRRMLNSGDLDATVAAAAAAPAGVRTPELDYAHHLYSHVQRRVREIRNISAPPRDGALGLVICWGEAFTRGFLELTLPSLLHPGNFPRLATYKPVELRVMTDILGRMIFKQDERMRELERHVTVTYELLPSPVITFPRGGLGVGSAYMVFGALWHLAVIEAIATGRDVFLVGADVVYSADSWGYIGELAKAGAELIFACAFSANRATIEPHLKRYIDESGHLAISHHELMDEAFRHLHPRSRGGFVTDYNRHATQNVSYLFFPTEDGVTERVMAPTPLYLKHSALKPDAVFEFLTNDGQFIDRILPEPEDWDRIHHITDNERYCSLELSPPEKNTGEGSICRISPQMVAARADTFGHIRKMRKMIEVGYHFRGTKPPPWPPHDSSAFIAEVMRRLREA